MPYEIEEKIVIAIASSALFDLSESDRIFKEQGLEEYNKYQEENIDNFLEKGVAFPFIKRFLNLNKIFEKERPVEVILLSRNSPETGMRVFRSIEHYSLDISRGAFFSGSSPYKYIPAFNALLFLSANDEDVKSAINAGYTAGKVIKTEITDDDGDNELRIAFDFDSVLADDSSERFYQKKGDLGEYLSHERENSEIPLNPGPLKELCFKISQLQQLETEKIKNDTTYNKIIRTSVITARNAPSHERMIRSLKSWGVTIDEAHFLGNIEKKRILEVLKPHIYFDDQIKHLVNVSNIPLVHIPFGVMNEVKTITEK